MIVWMILSHTCGASIVFSNTEVSGLSALGRALGWDGLRQTESSAGKPQRRFARRLFVGKYIVNGYRLSYNSWLCPIFGW